MSDGDLLSWPSFVLKQVTCPEGTPDEIRQALSGRGVPARSVGGEYAALNRAVFLEAAPHLLAFGRSVGTERICVDVRSLEVVHVSRLDVPRAHPVNANLAAFCASIEVAIARFPYYTYETVDEQGGEVARELREQLLKIDEVTNAHNSFWETFLDDVEMGNYATEEFQPKA